MIWNIIRSIMHERMHCGVTVGARTRQVVGVFLGDERMWSGASLQNLTVVTRLIRRVWPEALIYINEARQQINDANGREIASMGS